MYMKNKWAKYISQKHTKISKYNFQIKYTRVYIFISRFGFQETTET